VAVWRSQQVPWKSSTLTWQQNLGTPDLTPGYSSASQPIMLMLLLLKSAAADQWKELPGRRTGTYRGPHIPVHTNETARSDQYSCNAHSCPYSLHSRAHWAVRRTAWSITITTARDVPFKRDFAVGNVGSVRQGRFMAKFPISSLLPYLDQRCASSSMVMEKQSPTPALLVQRDTGLILNQNTL